MIGFELEAGNDLRANLSGSPFCIVTSSILVIVDHNKVWRNSVAVINDDAIQFMAELWDNNNKAWFDANRERYAEVLREPFKALRDDLEHPLSMLLTDIPEPKISRINRDIRFTKDKVPYKEHVWIKWVDKPAELMAAISRHGWSGVVSVCGEKKEDMEVWRRNLIDHHDLWTRYAKGLGLRKSYEVHAANPYKKPLYDDIPDDVMDLVQARVIYIYPESTPKFSKSPTGDYLTQLAMLLPAYQFMKIPGARLPDELSMLGDSVIPPNKKVAKVWDSVRV